MSNASSPMNHEGTASTASSPMTPPPMAKSPLSSSITPGMTGEMGNSAQPNSPNGYIPADVEVPVSAQSSPEDVKEPLDSSKGRLIENEKVLEYGGPNNRYGKVFSSSYQGSWMSFWEKVHTKLFGKQSTEKRALK